MSTKRQLHKIESLIRKLDFPNDTPLTSSQIHKYVTELFEAIDDAIPKYLFKYRKGTEKDLDALRNKQLLLSVPAKLNDPTESMAYVDANNIVLSLLLIPNEAELFNDEDEEDAMQNYIVQ